MFIDEYASVQPMRPKLNFRFELVLKTFTFESLKTSKQTRPSPSQCSSLSETVILVQALWYTNGVGCSGVSSTVGDSVLMGRKEEVKNKMLKVRR